MPGAEDGLRPEQRQALEAENAALAEQLSSVGRGAAQAESTMRELATLNQMLSTQARVAGITECTTAIVWM